MSNGVFDLEEILMEKDDDKFCSECVAKSDKNCGECSFGFDLNNMEVWRTKYRSE